MAPASVRSYTEAELRTASQMFAAVGEALGGLLDPAVNLIAEEPLFGGIAVHALDHVVALATTTGPTAVQCEQLASDARARADLVATWRVEQLAHRSQLQVWSAARRIWETEHALHLLDPIAVPSPGEPPVPPVEPSPPAAWADLEIR